MLGWAQERKINLVHTQPGRPMQNGHVESFHDRLRDECLNASWFRTLNELRPSRDNWRREYNCDRPPAQLIETASPPVRARRAPRRQYFRLSPCAVFRQAPSYLCPHSDLSNQSSLACCIRHTSSVHA